MSALSLRVLACLLMIADHVGYCFAGRYPWMECLRIVGRVAFPLYVFLLVNGFRHTKNRRRYAVRLGIFAVLSQLPYALFCKLESPIAELNVFFSLLLCLLTVWAMDALLQRKKLKLLAFLPPLVVVALCYLELLPVEYNAKGILMALIFYFFADKPVVQGIGVLLSVHYSWLLRDAGRLVKGKELLALTPWTLTQSWSVLAVIPIAFYNGKAGRLPANPHAKKAVQLGFYLFYPLHLLLLWAVR